MKKRQGVMIIKVKIVFAFGEREGIMTEKGSRNLFLVLFLGLGGG